MLFECADFNRWKIEELNIQFDHVHVLVQMRPEISVSKMVQLFKGMSSKVIREEFPELKKAFNKILKHLIENNYFDQ